MVEVVEEAGGRGGDGGVNERGWWRGDGGVGWRVVEWTLENAQSYQNMARLVVSYLV